MSDQSQLSTELVALADLVPDPANLREHGDRNLDAVKGSLRRFGQQKPIVVDSDGVVVAGNATLAAASALGWERLAVVRTGLEGSDRTAYAIADNRTAEHATWSDDLASALTDLKCQDAELAAATGFTDGEIEDLVKGNGHGVTEDEAPAVADGPVVAVLGDVWACGRHRLLCGDATDEGDVGRLLADVKVQLVHADPPYGMGKAEIENDNLYREKLDAFQMAWWRAVRPHVEDNASAYIWGNAENLWRLWYVGGLKDSERLTFRNEIIWNQVTGVSWGKDGMAGLRMYAPMGERCLFFMLGEQGFNNNADNYWEGWEPIRAYLEGEMQRCGWTVADLNRITGTQMASHWVTTSQWCLITAEHYATIQEAVGEHDAFKREHDAFKREHDELKREHDELKQEFYATRAYFDNTHDNMTDVWDFKRVTGEDRHGHATPKPVELVGRIIKSSSQDGDVIADPFLGSGTTMIAAEQLGRTCYGMEIEPRYVDVCLKRYMAFTGDSPTRESDGAKFAELVAELEAAA